MIGLPVPQLVNLGKVPCPQECDDIVILHNWCWSRSLDLYVSITSPPPPLMVAAMVSVNPAPSICPRWRRGDAGGNALLPSLIAVPSSNQLPLSPSCSFRFLCFEYSTPSTITTLSANRWSFCLSLSQSTWSKAYVPRAVVLSGALVPPINPFFLPRPTPHPAPLQ